MAHLDERQGGEKRAKGASAACLYTDVPSSESDERGDVHSKDLVLVLGGATRTSSPAHALHMLYTRLSERSHIDVIVVDPTPEAEWTEHCAHRATYTLKHEPMDLDTLWNKQRADHLLATYRRIAVIDDVFFSYCGYADQRLQFRKSAGYVALKQTAQENAQQFTWWEIDRRDRYEGPKFVQLLFGADVTIEKLSALSRFAPRTHELIKRNIREVDARFLVEQLFSP